MPTRFRTVPVIRTEPVRDTFVKPAVRFGDAGARPDVVLDLSLEKLLPRIIQWAGDLLRQWEDRLLKPYYLFMARSTIQPNLFGPRPATSPGLNRFAVIGDPGSGKGPQFDIADRMLERYEKTPFASALVLGDNVYEHGEVEKFHRILWRPYRHLYNKGIRFFPVLGNHDVHGTRGDEQLHYWGAPRYYSFKIDDGKNAGNDVEFFAIDTTVLLPGYDNCYKGDELWAKQTAKRQLEWLDKSLSQSKAKYKIVYGHYPLYSSGMHGLREDVTLRLRDILEPILERNSVDVYLAGHEHHYERSHPIKGVTHILSGGAGRSRKIHYEHDFNYPRAAAVEAFHFMLFEITPDGLKYQAIDREDRVIDEGVITKPEAGQKAAFA